MDAVAVKTNKFGGRSSNIELFRILSMLMWRIIMLLIRV